MSAGDRVLFWGSWLVVAGLTYLCLSGIAAIGAGELALAMFGR